MKSRRGIIALAGSLIAAASIIGVSLVFASSVGGAVASEAAISFSQTESAIAALTTAQGAVQQALSISEVSERDGAEAIVDARIVVGVARDRLAQVSEDSAAAEALEIRYLDSSLDALDYAEAGDFESARSVVAGPLTAQFSQLVEMLIELSSAQATELQEMGDEAAAAAQVTRFVIGLAIPLGLGLFLWLTYRKRESERILIEQVDSERTLRSAREDFIANVSHELRTPLTAVFGFAHLLDAGLIDDPEEEDDLIRLVYGEAGELVRMVEDLLTAARLTEGDLAYKLESVRAVDEVAEVAEVFSRMGTDVSVEVDDGYLRADRLRFRQIVRNLLSNAARYGGDSVVIRGSMQQSVFRLLVADDGDGVPDVTLGTMFDRFSQYEDASLARGGLGLGLSIVRTLLEDMGGSIRYERVDGWSRFVVDMPGAAAPSDGASSRVVSEVAATSASEPIVVASLAPSPAVAVAGPAGPRAVHRLPDHSPVPGR